MNNRKLFAFLLTTFMIVGLASPFMLQPATGATNLVISPSFTVYLLTPSTNPARQQWALLIQNNLQALGIQAQRVIVDWDIIYARALIPDPSVAGKIHTQGGFDTLFVGYAISPEAAPFSIYDSSQYAPDSGNYYFLNDSFNDYLCRAINAEPNETARAQLIIDWQEYFYKEILASICIYNSKEVVAFDPHMNRTVFQKYHYPLWPNVELWQFNDSTTAANMAQTGLPISFSSPHTSSYYDLGYSGPIYGEARGGGLMVRGYDYLMHLYAASSYTVTPDYLNWTFHITPGIYFHDGEELDARDVVATFRATMTPAFGSVSYAYYKGILGDNKSVYFAGEDDTAGESLPYDKYEVHFDLPAIWAFATIDLGGNVILPASVLMNGTYDFGTQNYMDTSLPASTLAGFALTSFGTAVGSSYTFDCKNGSAASWFGPFSIGPYKFASYDPGTYLVHLVKYDNYFRRAELEAQGGLQITDYYSQYIAGLAAAITALEGGDVQVLDSQYSTQTSIGALDPAWSDWVSYDAYGIQELGFNMNHPVFGTGVDTPLGQAFPERAAEAALHVRKAFEWLVPKKDVCNVLLNGFGSPGLTDSVTPAMVGFDFDLYNSADYRNGSSSDAQFNAMQELRLAGYAFIVPPVPSFWETYGLLITVVELAVIVVLAGFYFYRPRKM